MNIEEQKNRIKRQIASEQRIYEAWKNFKKSEFRDAVMNQALGVVKGLEVALESLEYLQTEMDGNPDQVTTEDWLKMQDVSG